MAFDGLARFCWFPVIASGQSWFCDSGWFLVACLAFNCFWEVPGGLGWFLVAFGGFWWPALVSVVSGSSW